MGRTRDIYGLSPALEPNFEGGILADMKRMRIPWFRFHERRAGGLILFSSTLRPFHTSPEARLNKAGLKSRLRPASLQHTRMM